MDVTVIRNSSDKDGRPELLCLIGLHACGKSSFALAQTGYHVWSFEEYCKNAPDSVRDDQLLRSMLCREMRRDLKSGNSIIYDDSNLPVKRRRGLFSDLGSVSCRKTAVLFVCPREVCLERNAARPEPVAEERIDGQMRKFDPPSFIEGWDEIRIVWHEGRIRDPWLDGFVLDQQNRHHSLPLDEHMRLCARLSFEQGASSEACFAASVHDNGKRWTQSFENREGIKDGQAHYFGHDKYGAYQYLVHANSLRDILRPADEGFDLYISWLIANHMRPYAWEVSPSLEKKDEQAWGERAYRDIKDLHRADAMAH